MYEEVVKKLRRCVRSKCRGCEYEYVVSCRARLNEDTASAIEELQEDNSALNGTVSNLIGQIAELNKPRWVPCSERLPDESKWYLISNGLDSWVAIWSKENKEWLSVTGFDYTIADVIAWMEFPEPYEPPKEFESSVIL